MYPFINEKQPIIVATDHGYGNIKTSHFCFKSGVTAYDTEPPFQSNLLIYHDHLYIIGEDRMEFSADKTWNDDYCQGIPSARPIASLLGPQSYILTLAAIAMELDYRNLRTATVQLAVGLPLTWVGQQKVAFKAYLLQNESVDFTFRGTTYHVEFSGADVFPQGFAAVADHLKDFSGVNMLCDIGSGTMNIMYINSAKPISSKCFTEKYGTQQCMIAVREQLLRQFGTTVEDDVIEEVLRTGTADIGQKYLDAITATAAEYVSGIMRRLREHEYNPELMKLYVMGGGSCLIKNFGTYDPERVTINEDICATAKGYETLARLRLKQNGGIV